MRSFYLAEPDEASLGITSSTMESIAPKKFNPDPFPYHHELELTVESLTNLGVGVAKVDGWVVMVHFAVPGERIRARIYRNHKNYSEADLIKVIEASPYRKQPSCEYFGKCGGCQYQHMTYAHQLTWKSRHVTEVMEKIGGMKLEVPTPLHSEKELRYRSKITPHHQKPRQQQLGSFGFLAVARRNQIVDIESCVIATEAINEEFAHQREIRQLEARKGKLKKGATLLLRHSMEGVTTQSQDAVTEKVGNRIFQFKAGDFFQNNPYALPVMVEHVVEQAASSNLPNLIDAYCGSGLFSISAAHEFESVLGIEISESSIKWAKANAALNQIKNCNYIAGDASEIFSNVPFAPDETVIIIDPPRKGCDEVFLNQLFSYQPARVVYVSCDPATQARDLKLFVENNYSIRNIQPIDLFPQTRHIENVITLDREAKSG